MSNGKLRLALFPGTFDPVTNGHLDVIRRAAELFDEILVAVGDNPDKTALLDQEDRVEILREALCDCPNVRVEGYRGLTVDFARASGAGVIVRGIRDARDLGTEFQAAATNRTIAGVETLLLMTRGEHAYISSSLIRQIAAMGGDVSGMVPAQVLPRLAKAVGRS